MSRKTRILHSLYSGIISLVTMDTNKQILQNRQDVILIVDRFYNKVRSDDLLGPIFNDIVKVDWNEHLPKLYNFWEDLLFGTDNYKGRPFPPHVHLSLQLEHFDQWLKLFIETIDENFVGFKAEEMKNRAKRIAYNFSINLNLISTPRVT